MGYGLEIYNAAGRLQFDSSRRVLVLASKTTATYNYSSSFGRFQFQVSNPINHVVCWTSSDFVLLTNVTISGGVWTYYFEHAGSSVNVTLYYFDDPSKVAPANYGLQVFEPGGALLYDAVAHRPFRPIAVSGTAFPWSLGIPPGKTYAACYATPAIGIQQTDLEVWWATFIRIKMQAGTLSADQWARRHFPDVTKPNPPDTWNVGTVMVCDVTGY